MIHAGKRVVCGLLLLLAGVAAHGATAPAASADAARDARIAAFARLYGVVRYFYPGDAAQDIDWNRFAVAGVTEARAAGDAADLRERMQALFAPLGPGIEIAGENEEFPPAAVDANPPLLAWRYVGFPSTLSQTYLGERTGRGRSSGGFTALATELDGAALQGKRLRLRADIEPLSALNANDLGLWLRVDRPDGKRGFFANSAAQAKPGRAWQTHEIVALVDTDATAVAMGLSMTLGNVETARAGFRNLTLEADDGHGRWIPVDELPALRTAADSAAKAWRVTGEVRKGIDVSWQQPGGDTGFLQLEHRNDPATDALVDASVVPGNAWQSTLGAGLKARVALTLSDAQARPSSDRAAALAALKARLASLPEPSADIASVDVRQADVVVAWNVFAHFFPYWDVVDTDWNAALPRALADATAATTREAHQDVLKRLLVPLQDGHGWVSDNQVPAVASLPIRLEPTDGEWAVTATAVPAQAQIGDVVTAIDGVPIAEARPRLESLASSRPGARVWAALSSLTVDTRGTTRKLALRRADGSVAEVVLKYDTMEFALPPRPAPIAELKPGVMYVDPSRATKAQFATDLQRLAQARAIVFDLREYPGELGAPMLTHLLTQPERTQWMHIPLYVGPFGQRAGYRDAGWDLEPATPHFGGRAVFLANGNTVSYGESIIGYVHDLRLGTIVGATTRGVNGSITSFATPSGFRVVFTGMKVTRHDGSGRYHAIGTPPDVAVEPTVAGVRAGRDEVLDAALALLDRPADPASRPNPVPAASP
jgi:C-terminal processing protease CtpA/Prc